MKLPSRSLSIVTTLLALSRQSFAQSSAATESRGLRPGQIKNIVTFGDSYTDIVLAGDGGRAWPLYVAQYGNLNLFPFARAGATCSNNLTFRPFPPVFESQLPTYFAERANGSVKLDERETVYTLWIGTNDVGSNALLTGGQAPGVTVVDTVTCAVNWVQTLYNSGARNFIFQNMIPLQHVREYQADSYLSHYWTAQRNSTEWNLFITELTTAGNAISRLMLQNLAPKLAGAHVGLFDSHGLFTDIINNPQNYLNGTAPLNVTGSISSCMFQLDEDTSGPANCTLVTGTDRDSFLWFDELHPSEQADRTLARHITNAIQGKADRWTTWFS